VERLFVWIMFFSLFYCILSNTLRFLLFIYIIVPFVLIDHCHQLCYFFVIPLCSTQTMHWPKVNLHDAIKYYWCWKNPCPASFVVPYHLTSSDRDCLLTKPYSTWTIPITLQFLEMCCIWKLDTYCRAQWEFKISGSSKCLQFHL